MGRIQTRSHNTTAITPRQLLGQKAEQQALDYLKQQGLKLRERNFQCALGEIDLIMQDKDSVVFVEVRYRGASHYGTAHATVTPAKQHKIIRTASLYLQKKQLYDKVACRFDVVALQADVIEWIPNAFTV